MPEPTLAARVENHEERLALLEALPARIGAVELQILQLRSEMGEQFFATRQDLRAEIKAEGEAVRTELRAEIKAEGEAVRTELRAEIKAEGEAIRTELRAELRAGDEETRRYMRVLHEEVLARIAGLQEGRPPRRRQR